MTTAPPTVTLPRHMTPSLLPAFINLLAERRKDGKVWAVAHLKLAPRDDAAQALAELRQLLDHAF